MLITIKRNIEKFAISLLILFHLMFFLSILLVDGYPQTNDILHIFKITPLDGKLKFINGIYGPGYTYYSLIFSNSLTILSIIICVLSVLSSVMIVRILNLFSFTKKNEEKFTIYLLSILFHLILITTIGFNHSDSIFILLFYNGLLFFTYGYYLKKDKFFNLIGLLVIGISVLFRHHGPFALFLLFINFILFESYYEKKFKLYFKNYFYFAIILALPTVLSQVHLYSIDAIVNWQTTFKLHFFFHGDTWGNWRDLKYVLESEEVKNFNISKVELNHGIQIVLNHIKGVLRITYPFIFCFLIAFYISKKKIIFYSLILFLFYLLIVLAGYHRGYYPGIFFCFIAMIICFKEISKNKISSFFIFIFLFGHLIYLVEKYSSDVLDKFIVNKDIKQNVVPLLNSKKIKYQNIFSDDYEFYTTNLDGEIHKICNWGGWFLNHPYLYDYYPAQVVVGKKNKYCEVKAFITREENIAKKYLTLGNFNNQYKTNVYYLLIKN